MSTRRFLPLEELRRLYCDQRMTLKEIAEVMGCSIGSVWRTLRDGGVQLRKPTAQLLRSIQKVYPEEHDGIIHELRSGVAPWEIADRLGVDPETIRIIWRRADDGATRRKIAAERVRMRNSEEGALSAAERRCRKAIEERDLSPLIFLDIDGVLNNESTHSRINGHRGLDPRNVRELNRLVETVPGVKLILSSSWRSYPLEQMRAWLAEAGATFAERLVGTTPAPRLSSRCRCHEIADVLREMKRIRRRPSPQHDAKYWGSFVVLDDDTSDYAGLSSFGTRFIACDPIYGFTEVERFRAEVRLRRARVTRPLKEVV